MLRHKGIRISFSSIRYYLLAVSPILHMYRFISIVTWGEVALVLAILVPCSNTTYLCNNVVKKTIVAICIYFGINTILAGVGISEDFFNSIKEYLVFLIYYVIAFMMINRTDYKQFLRIYKNIAVFTGIFVIIQFLSYTFLGNYISGLVPNVTTYAGVSSNYYISRAMNRSAGFFTEPAMCSRYLSIPFLLCINALSESDKKFLDTQTIILSCALLFTMAGNGIMALIIGYCIYTYKCIKKRNASGMLRLFIIIGLLAVSFVFLNRIPMFNRMFARIYELSGNSSMKSGYIRIVRGFVAYFNLPFWAKIFGIGFGNYLTVINKYIYDIMTADTDMILYWLNGIQDYFIYGGIIGVSLFTKLLFNSWQNGDECQRTILILFIAYLFVAGMFTEPLWVIFMVVLFGNNFEKSKEDNYDICNYTNA